MTDSSLRDVARLKSKVLRYQSSIKAALAAANLAAKNSFEGVSVLLKALLEAREEAEKLRQKIGQLELDNQGLRASLLDALTQQKTLPRIFPTPQPWKMPDIPSLPPYNKPLVTWEYGKTIGVIPMSTYDSKTIPMTTIADRVSIGNAKPNQD